MYLSRIPPYMRPAKMKHLLSSYGEITNLYLVPEDDSLRRRRKKSGGNTRKNYVEGWVEYSDKRVAKNVALCLNNTMIGGPKGSYYHDDIWNLKYLSKFRWEHLTEKISYERRVREQRVRHEVATARREAGTHLLLYIPLFFVVKLANSLLLYCMYLCVLCAFFYSKRLLCWKGRRST